MKKIFWLTVAFAWLLVPVMGQNRIVSLAPSLTQNLYFLGLEDKIAGVTSYCEIAKADKKEIVATAIKVNHEKVVLQKPDLVIATGMTNPETISLLRKFGIRVEVFPKVHSFEEICAQFLLLGELTGRQEQARQIVGDARERVQALRRPYVAGKGPKIFFQIGAKPLYTVIPNTFMDDYITFVGGVNVVQGVSNPAVTRESVVVSNPDVIIIVTMGIVGDEEKGVWESYRSLNATRQKKIFIIDSDKACTPTPITFVQTLEEIIGLIYGQK